MATWATQTATPQDVIDRGLARLRTQNFYLQGFVQEWTIWYFGQMLSEPLENAISNLKVVATLNQARNLARQYLNDAPGEDTLDSSQTSDGPALDNSQDQAPKRAIYWSMDDQQTLSQILDVPMGELEEALTQAQTPNNPGTAAQQNHNPIQYTTGSQQPQHGTQLSTNTIQILSTTQIAMAQVRAISIADGEQPSQNHQPMQTPQDTAQQQPTPHLMNHPTQHHATTYLSTDGIAVRAEFLQDAVSSHIDQPRVTTPADQVEADQMEIDTDNPSPGETGLTLQHP